MCHRETIKFSRGQRDDSVRAPAQPNSMKTFKRPESGFSFATSTWACLCGALLLIPIRSHGVLADVAAGQTKFNTHCFGCHGDPAVNFGSVLFGANKSTLQGIANGTIAHMGGTFPFDTFSAADFNNVAAYIASRDPRSYSVQGRVYVNGGGLANCQISISSAYNSDTNTLTDANGNFQVAGMRPGQYFVLPYKLSYVLAPASRNIAMDWYVLTGGTNTGQSTAAQNGVLSNVNFTATLEPIEISGYVRTPAGVAISNVAIGITPVTNLTDATGKYLLTDLMPGTYTVVPAKVGHLFIPAPVTVELTEINRQAFVDFTGGTNAIVRVRSTGNDNNDGSTWALAKRTVTGAVAVAMQEIWVAKRTNAVGPLPYFENIALRPGLGLYGGFAGTETNRDQRNPVANLTILDGSLNRVVDLQSLFDGGVTKSAIDGFTIIRGGNQGAGIRVRDTGQTVSNCRFITNSSANSGGAIWVSGGSPLIVSNTFDRNSAAVYGGAIFCDGSPTILNNLMVSNVASSAGGAIHIRDGVVANNLIVSNTASAEGGGIYCNLGAVLVANNTLVGNTAPLLGGAIQFANAATPTVANNIVAFNARGLATADGSTPVLLNNCVFSNALFNYSGLVAGAGDISADPLFVNLAVGNLHLLSNSPCLDAGTNSVVAPAWRDLDGELRLQGARVDIGADELPAPLEITLNPPVASGGNLMLTGSGGLPGAGYTWLTSTNVAAPLATWTTNTSGTFDGSGGFANAIPINRSETSRFFRLRIP